MLSTGHVIAHNNYAGCPSIWAALSLLINILLGSFQLFLHSDPALSEGEIIPVQRCLPVGGRLHYPRRRRWWLHALTDEPNDVQPTTTSSIITQSIIFSFSIPKLLLRVFCIERSNITLTHLHVSNCRVRQLQFSGIFVAQALWVMALSR